MSTAVALYDPLRRQTIVIGTGYARKSHYLDRHGRILCGQHKGRHSVTAQATLDAAPTCGWCRLIISSEAHLT